ncbi:hypothetical protein BRADI_3g54135v3 [Brachypodium distachyon]|uniref:Uncharacterized protein n=1 Tax=Brachypodium distachyon TaxID=15368 RepID=A0A0Q3QHR5_BRADI|nr:hypothetical protein BRADI_3g54135v3 [Brachypodium distachyon]
MKRTAPSRERATTSSTKAEMAEAKENNRGEKNFRRDLSQRDRHGRSPTIPAWPRSGRCLAWPCAPWMLPPRARAKGKRACSGQWPLLPV